MTRAELKDASQSKFDYHRDRFSWWENEEATAKTAIRENGLTISENPVTGGYRTEVQIAPPLLTRLNECVTKKKSHEGQRDEFKRWVEALDRADEGFNLAIDDLQFFGLFI